MSKPVPATVQPEPHPDMRRFRIFLVLALASSFSTLSMDFFAPSMPAVSRDLGVSAKSVQAAMTLFLIGYAAGPFIWGSLADRIGRRRVLFIGIGSFGLSSLGCLLASGVEVFWLFRLAQGFSAASTAIVARAVLRDVYGAGGATRAIARMFLIMVWVPISGPLVGGFLSAAFGWRVNFAVMVACAVAIMAASFAWLRETNPSHDRYALTGISRWREIIIHPVFLRHTLTNMLFFAALLLFLSNYSYVTEKDYGLSSLQNGLVLTAFNASVAAGFYLVWPLVPRLGVEGGMSVGRWLALVCWTAILLMALMPQVRLALMLPCVVLACIGTGLVISLAAGEALVPFPHAAGTASAIFILVQSAGASLITYLASVAFDITFVHLAGVLALCAMLANLASRISARPAR